MQILLGWNIPLPLCYVLVCKDSNLLPFMLAQWRMGEVIYSNLELAEYAYVRELVRCSSRQWLYPPDGSFKPELQPLKKLFLINVAVFI